jgi:hypothetical protein
VARSISIVTAVVATTVLIAHFAVVPGEPAFAVTVLLSLAIAEVQFVVPVVAWVLLAVPASAWTRMFLPAAAGVQLAGLVVGEAVCRAPVVPYFGWMGETLSGELLSSGGRENQYRPAAIIRRLFLRPATHAHRLQRYGAHHHVRPVLYRSFSV